MIPASTPPTTDTLAFFFPLWGQSPVWIVFPPGDSLWADPTPTPPGGGGGGSTHLFFHLLDPRIPSSRYPLSLLWRQLGLRSLFLNSSFSQFCQAAHGCFTLILWRYFISGRCGMVPSALLSTGLPRLPVV